MNLLSERLTLAMKEKSARDGVEVIPADIARAGRTSAAAVNYWLNEVNGIGAAKARLVANYLGVNALWLESGEGEMLLPMLQIDGLPVTDKEINFIRLYRASTDAGKSVIESACSWSEKLDAALTRAK